MRWSIGLLVGFTCLISTMPGLDLLGSCPEQNPGILQFEAEIERYSHDDELLVNLVLRNRGRGSVMIYPYIVPMSCHQTGGAYLYLEITVQDENGKQQTVTGECPGRLRAPSGYEFLRLQPQDYLGRQLNLKDEPFLFPRLEPGNYELHLAIRSGAREYLERNHPQDLPCSSNLLFQGRVVANPIELVVPTRKPN